MRDGAKFFCDFPECKSTVELSDPRGLETTEEQKKVLDSRGWMIVVAKSAKGEKILHGCNAHCGQKFLPEILGTVE